MAKIFIFMIFFLSISINVNALQSLNEIESQPDIRLDDKIPDGVNINIFNWCLDICSKDFNDELKSDFAKAIYFSKKYYDEYSYYPAFTIYNMCLDKFRNYFNYKELNKLLKDEADKGNNIAQYVLYKMYDLNYKSNNIFKNIPLKDYIKYKSNAADSGIIEAQSDIENEKDVKKSLKRDYKEILINAAENNNHTAQYHLSMNYFLGSSGFESDDKKGIYWLEKSANNNDIGAQISIARDYENGYRGLNKDLSKAIYWLNRYKNNIEDNYGEVALVLNNSLEEVDKLIKKLRKQQLEENIKELQSLEDEEKMKNNN